MVLKESIIAFVSIFAVLCAEEEYRSKGCFKDRPNRAISGGYTHFNENPVHKCFLKAKGNGYEIFGVEENRYCFTSLTAPQTYYKYGPSVDCVGGKGGVWAMDVYQLKPTGSFLLTKIHLLVQEMKRKQNEIDQLTRETKAIKEHSEAERRNISARLTAINSKVDRNTNGIAELAKLDLIYYPPGTTEHKAQRRYPKFRATFVGYEYPGKVDGFKYKGDGLTVKECAERCYGEYQKDKAWNYIWFYFVNNINRCYCYKNARNMIKSNNHLHYKFE